MNQSQFGNNRQIINIQPTISGINPNLAPNIALDQLRKTQQNLDRDCDIITRHHKDPRYGYIDILRHRQTQETYMMKSKTVGTEEQNKKNIDTCEYRLK